MISDFDQRARVCTMILNEYDRQIELQKAGKFRCTCEGVWLTNAEKAVVLVEEVGEVCRNVLNLERLAFDNNRDNLEKELIQVAAVAFAWVKGLEERKKIL